MANFLKPLNAGKSKASTSVAYALEGDGPEKPFLAEGPDYNPRLEQEDKVGIYPFFRAPQDEGSETNFRGI